MRPDEIERPAVTLVRVEAVVEELAEKPPALGDAEDICTPSANGQVGAVTEGRCRVANGGEAHTGDPRARGRVVEFVQQPRFEPAIQHDAWTAVRIGRGESPGAPWQQRRRVAKERADGQRGRRIIRVNGCVDTW